MSRLDTIRSGPPDVALPRLRPVRDMQVRDTEPCDSGLGRCAQSGSTFIANLAARARRGTRKRGNGGRVIMRFNLDQRIHNLVVVAIHAIVVGIQSWRARSGQHGGVVRIGADDAGGRRVGRIADHREQRKWLRDIVDDPVRVEYLVPAMLGIRLREHHQFRIGRIAPHLCVVRRQIGKLVLRQRQPKLRICRRQRLQWLVTQRYGLQRTSGMMVEQQLAGLPGDIALLGHTVVQQLMGNVKRCIIKTMHLIACRALNTAHTVDTAASDNIGCLAGPRRDCSAAWTDVECVLRCQQRVVDAIIENQAQRAHVICVGPLVTLQVIEGLCVDIANRGHGTL